MPRPFVELEQLDEDQNAPILSYNVPEPVSFSGQCVIELPVPDSYFRPEAAAAPPTDVRTPIGDLMDDTKTSDDSLGELVVAGFKSGFNDPASRKAFPNARIEDPSDFRWLAMKKQLGWEETPTDKAIAEIITMVRAGLRLNIYQNMYGYLDHNYLPDPERPKPYLLLVETYTLSSFLGNYGAGRTLNTFTLLPGEETKISIETYRRTAKQIQQASCILDSVSRESASQFEHAVQREAVDKTSHYNNFQYHAEAQAQANLGWLQASASGGIAGQLGGARERFARSVESTTGRHAAAASNRRDIQVNTALTAQVEEGQASSIERRLKNVNLSRTLNFVFRQMNQEYVTVLHLVDARVAFFNGYGESRREVSLDKLDELLGDVIVGPVSDPQEPGITVRSAQQSKVHDMVVGALSSVFDYQNKRHSLINVDSEGNLPEDEPYLLVKKDMVSAYSGTSGPQFSVPGIIMSAQTNVLRTDGVIVEAILGQGNAVDEFKKAELEETAREKGVRNDLVYEQMRRLKTAREIVADKDTEAAELYQKVYGSGAAN